MNNYIKRIDAMRIAIRNTDPIMAAREIEDHKSEDVVLVVRCEKCSHWRSGICHYDKTHDRECTEKDFCSFGKPRKE